MSDAAYEYARYDGDSRSSWERLTWIESSQSHSQPRQRRDDFPSDNIIDDPVVVSEEVQSDQGIEGIDFDGTNFPTSNAASSDQIELDLTKWDKFDFVTAIGVILLILGFLAAFSPELHKVGLLVPAGLGTMTLGILGARRRDAAHLS